MKQLHVVALVLSVVGLCLPPLLLISAALALYGLYTIRSEQNVAQRRQIFRLTLAVSGSGLVIFLGLMLPNVKHFQLRMKQRECKTTLEELVAAQHRLYAQSQRYSTEPAELGLQAKPGQVVKLAVDPVIPEAFRNTVGLQGDCPACSITMVCMAHLGGNSALDLWTASTAQRTGKRGETIPAGMPWNEVDGVSQ